MVLTTVRLSFLVFVVLAATNFAQVPGDPHPELTARANALTKSANQKMRDGDLDGALADFNRVIEIDKMYPENVQSASYLSRGVVYEKRGDFDAALADFNKAIKLQSNNVFAYQNRAGLYEQLNEIEKAIADYSKVIKLNSKFPFAYKGRGLLLLKQGKDTEAEADFAKFLQLYPDGKEGLEKQIEEVKQKRAAKP